MNDLTVINHNKIFTVDSREVAEMVKKKHKELLRDIRTYIDQMNEANEEIENPSAKLHSAYYFIESTYLDSNNQERPCYLITKIGCDFIANKLTGVKGTAFTATYTKKFEEMEQTIKASRQLPDYKQKEIEARYNNSVVRKVRELRRIVEDPVTPETYKQVLNSKITEMLTGQNLLPLPEAEKTYTATEIGKELGVTANKIGRIANEFNLKTPEYGIQVWDKSPHNAKEVPSWRYNERGRAKLHELLA